VLLSQICLAILFCGLAGKWMFLSVGLLLLAAGRLARPALPRDWRWWLAAPFLFYYAVHALAPETTPDGITYHLGLVREWVRTGGFTARIGHFEIMPHGVEVLFAAAYSLGGHSSAKLVSFALLLLTAALIAGLARRLDLPTTPAALLFLFTPVVGITGTSSYVDASLACFAVATLALLLDGHNRWAALTAGFCYAVKMTGGAVTAATAVFLLCRRDWRAAILCALAPLPWILRAWVLTGNPLAPLFNAWFPSEHFHLSTEQSLAEFVATYGVPDRDLWRELTLGGYRTAGLLGPGFLFTPLALIALVRRQGRWLWIAAVVAGLPWLWNHGTRFLVPAVPFLALALVAALPRAGAWTLVALHGLLCLPPLVETWAHPKAWRLTGFPWKAALRLEDETEWLRRELPQFPPAEMLGANTKPGARVLDLATIATAYTDVTVFTHWQYANAERAAEALHAAAASDPRAFIVFRADLPSNAIQGFRLEQAGRARAGWSIAEVTLWRNGASLFPSQSWQLDASPHPSTLPLAFDRNPVSRWSSRGPALPGQFLEVRFPQPLIADRLDILRPAAETGTPFSAGVLVGERWTRLPLRPGDWVPLNLRRRAISYVRREGFTHIAASTGTEGWPRVGTDLVTYFADWGVERVAHGGGVYLLRIP